MTTWTRQGECNGCGWCCQFLEVVKLQQPPGPEARELMLLRGVDVSEAGGTFTAWAFRPCSKHEVEAKRCRIYDERPYACREWPHTPTSIIGTPCSYWFESDDGRRWGGFGSPYPAQYSSNRQGG